ncbi:RING finger protein 24 isoform X3 [Micropterus salmoides]|uniref:RING finger protein 24 isoform X3 n=1 Tax=Micropterus salmoides TaxID=27706 RepID=UPI0018ECC449|nr:RING finger protein 24 isoform X3 [Micropterus salmoides]
MSSDFPHYSFRMPNIGFQNLPLNIYIVVFGTAIFVFILSLLFCCYLISEKQQFPTKFTPRHLLISYLAGQTIPLTLLREVKVTCNGGYGTRRTKNYMHTNKENHEEPLWSLNVWLTPLFFWYAQVYSNSELHST